MCVGYSIQMVQNSIQWKASLVPYLESTASSLLGDGHCYQFQVCPS